MQGSNSLPPIPPPTRRNTSATLFQGSSREMQAEDQRYMAAEERPVYYNPMPIKALVDTLSLPSSIGTAIAAGATFTVLSSDSILGDNSPQSLVERQRMVPLLAWSSILFGIATVVTVCLQALYASNSFCQVMNDTLNYGMEPRTELEPRSSWDLLEFIIGYSAAAVALFTVALHLAATILILEVLKPYAPALMSQLVIGVFVFLSLAAWAGAAALRRRRRRAVARMEEIARAASTVGQKQTVPSLQVDAQEPSKAPLNGRIDA